MINLSEEIYESVVATVTMVKIIKCRKMGKEYVGTSKKNQEDP